MKQTIGPYIIEIALSAQSSMNASPSAGFAVA